MLPSWALFGMIVVGGAVAVIANTLYPLARAQEAKDKLASDARAILDPEIKSNLELIATFNTELDAHRIPFQKFQVGAWETISKGSLLLGLKSDEITKLLRVYGLVYRANEVNAMLLESTTGINATVSNAGPIRLMYISNLKTTLQELQTALSEVNKHS